MFEGKRQGLKCICGTCVSYCSRLLKLWSSPAPNKWCKIMCKNYFSKSGTDNEKRGGAWLELVSFRRIEVWWGNGKGTHPTPSICGTLPNPLTRDKSNWLKKKESPTCSPAQRFYGLFSSDCINSLDQTLNVRYYWPDKNLPHPSLKSTVNTASVCWINI